MPEAEQDQADNYDANAEKVAPDTSITKDEYEAQKRNQHLHDTIAHRRCQHKKSETGYNGSPAGQPLKLARMPNFQRELLPSSL